MDKTSEDNPQISQIRADLSTECRHDFRGVNVEAASEELDEDAVDGMIGIAKNIAHDYEHGFERTKDERACEGCGYGLYCGD